MDVKFAKAMRLIWIDHALTERGELQRHDIAQAFGTSIPLASADIGEYEARFPDLITYDARQRRYVRQGDMSAFDSDTRRAVVAAQKAVRAVSG